jgi:hypothetical protein
MYPSLLSDRMEWMFRPVANKLASRAFRLAAATIISYDQVTASFCDILTARIQLQEILGKHRGYEKVGSCCNLLIVCCNYRFILVQAAITSTLAAGQNAVNERRATQGAGLARSNDSFINNPLG